MQISRELTKPAARLSLVIGAGLATLIVAGFLVRPDMMMSGMRMLHGLIVGFGL